MLKKIVQHPLLMTWLSYLLQYGASLLVLPVILLKFSSAEVAVWLTFTTIYGLALLADAGFGQSLIRAASYFYHGAKTLPKTADAAPLESFNQSPNFNALHQLYNTTRLIYGLVLIVLLIFLATFGTSLVKNVIELANQSSLWLYYLIFMLACVLRVLYVRYSSFLQGLDRVAQVRRAESVVGASRIGLYLIFTLLNTGILGIVITDLLYGLALTLIARHQCLLFLKPTKPTSSSRWLYFDRPIFHSLWPSVWRLGLSAYGVYFIQNGIALLVTQIKDTQLIAAYLLTIRIFSIIRQLASAPLNAYLPNVIGFYAKGQIQPLKQFAGKRIGISLLLAVTACSLLLALGNPILDLLNVETRLLSQPYLLLMSITLWLEMHHSSHVQLYLTSNHMPFLIPAVATGLAIIVTGYYVLPIWGLAGLLWVQCLVQLSFNNWYPVMLSMRLFNWSWREYLSHLCALKRAS